MGGSIFVFGSNLAGRHGAGAAFHARKFHGAQLGVGLGRTGNAYAIPTKDAQLRPLSLPEIRYHVDTFLAYARTHPDLTFQVTRVGCGLAGYVDADIGPFFAEAPPNCTLPAEWADIRRPNTTTERAWAAAVEAAGGGATSLLASATASLNHWYHNKFVGPVPTDAPSDGED